jgi:hypothetical protein
MVRWWWLKNGDGLGGVLGCGQVGPWTRTILEIWLELINSIFSIQKHCCLHYVIILLLHQYMLISALPCIGHSEFEEFDQRSAHTAARFVGCRNPITQGKKSEKWVTYHGLRKQSWVVLSLPCCKSLLLPSEERPQGVRLCWLWVLLHTLTELSLWLLLHCRMPRGERDAYIAQSQIQMNLPPSS